MCKPLAVPGNALDSWPGAAAEELYVACWNVENLFDTRDDPSVEGDEEFTPQAAKRWTTERLQIKLAQPGQGHRAR